MAGAKPAEIDSEERDRIDLDSTSHLSVDLKYGWIGARRLFDVVGNACFVHVIVLGHELGFSSQRVRSCCRQHRAAALIR